MPQGVCSQQGFISRGVRLAGGYLKGCAEGRHLVAGVVLTPEAPILAFGVQFQAGIQVAMARPEPAMLVGILIQMPAGITHTLESNAGAAQSLSLYYAWVVKEGRVPGWHGHCLAEDALPRAGCANVHKRPKAGSMPMVTHLPTPSNTCALYTFTHKCTGPQPSVP